MFTHTPLDYSDKAKFYRDLSRELEPMLEKAWYTNLANASALLMAHLPNLNWAGFYLADGEILRLGPFQGLPACLTIPFGKGVCGTAARDRRTALVKDVHAFPGHIACDERSRSEIVVPLLLGERVLGVLDLDSPSLARFDETDQQALEEFASLLVSRTAWPDHF